VALDNRDRLFLNESRFALRSADVLEVLDAVASIRPCRTWRGPTKVSEWVIFAPYGQRPSASADDECDDAAIAAHFDSAAIRQLSACPK
jgi:hypothetical protein